MSQLMQVLNPDGDYALLDRVSSEEQAEEGISLETQRNMSQDYIIKNLGKVYKAYVEDGVSAFKKRVHQRPIIMELLSDIASGKIKHIVAYKRDRIVRDPEDYYYLRKIFSKAGVKVNLTSGERWGDPLTNTPVEELVDGMMPLLAKFESMTTSQRVRDNVREMVKKGHWRTGSPPYGYRYNKETKKVEQVPHQVPTVRLIRDLYVQDSVLARLPICLIINIESPMRVTLNGLSAKI